MPRRYVENGRIILNIAPIAVTNLDLHNDAVEFNARFGGTPFHVVVPLQGVSAIYARESGQGMIFSDNGDGPMPPEKAHTAEQPGTLPPRATLRVVK